MFVFDEPIMGKSRIVRRGLIWIANSIRPPNYGDPCFWFFSFHSFAYLFLCIVMPAVVV